MSDVFPYRFRAEDGLYAGTTFVYPGDGTVVSYSTASPEEYWITRERARTLADASHYPMTPQRLARYEAIPTRDERQAACQGR